MNSQQTSGTFASVAHSFYHWPQGRATDDALFEELRQRHPRASNIDIGVAILKARGHTAPGLATERMADKAENILMQMVVATR